MELKGQITSASASLKYMLAGKAFVTFRSIASGNRFTYKVELADKRNPKDPDIHFVSLLNGPDNWTNYKYIGIIRNGEYRWTAKSKIGQDAPSVKGFAFCFRYLSNAHDDSIIGFEVWHEGKCGRCGRKLTVPESVADGFGPECVNLVGGTRTPAPVAASGKAAVPQQASKTALEQSLQPRANGRPAQYTIEFTNLGGDDAEIRRRVDEYKANSPENYYQDGGLDEKQAFDVAYNMFRIQIEKERQ